MTPTTARPAPLISAQDLAAALSAEPGETDRLAVLDVRWALGGGSDPEGFAAGHLPGARFLDLEAHLSSAPSADGVGGRHPLPDPADVLAALRSLGVAGDQPVVVYDAGHGAAAARAWWVLRHAGLTDVRVLDGGLGAWQAAELPLEGGDVQGRPTAAAEPQDAEARGHLPTTDAAQISAALASEDAPLLLDARPAGRYAGEDLGSDPVGGHIPGAVNLPAASLSADDGTMLSATDLRGLFSERGVGPHDAVTLSCGSGITACQLALAHTVAFPDAPEPTLYPGSFSDWISDPSRPLEQGDGPVAG